MASVRQILPVSRLRRGRRPIALDRNSMPGFNSPRIAAFPWNSYAQKVPDEQPPTKQVFGSNQLPDADARDSLDRALLRDHRAAAVSREPARTLNDRARCRIRDRDDVHLGCHRHHLQALLISTRALGTSSTMASPPREPCPDRTGRNPARAGYVPAAATP